jgi:hypothetical protein
MEEHYLFKNTDSLKLTANLGVNSSSIIAKKKQYKIQSIISFLSLLMMFFLAENVSAQTTSTFTASGNWICPQGVTSVTVEAWGGGGRGGNSSGGSGAASGGGGGAYAKKTITVTPGNTYSVMVGLGGDYQAIANGGDSFFNNATTVKAAGGSAPGVNAVSGALGGLIVNCVGDVVYNGGNGGNSPATDSGGGGGGAGSNGNGGNGNLTTAGTGTSIGGGNGGSGVSSGVGSYSALTIGGGGGGAAGNNYAGGYGARGEVRITFVCPGSTSVAGSNQTLAACATTTTLAGNTPTYGTGTWSVVSGTATITTPSSATSGVTGLALGATATLRWTITNGLCGSSFSNITITTSRGAGCLVYCTPSVSSGYQSSNYIKDVNFIGNITNSDNASTYSSSPRGYEDHTNLGTRASQAQGEGINIYANTTGGANYMKAWVDWNSNGIFDESTEIVYQCTNAFINTTFGFKIPENTIPGNYTIRLRINKSNSASDNTFGACGNIVNYGETEDYLFTVVANCAAKITSITNGFNCGTGIVTLEAIGTAGTTEYRWYTAPTGGSYVTSASSVWSTPSIPITTIYYVTAYNGTCESLFRTAVAATIKPVSTLTISNATPSVCGENSIIDLDVAGTNEQIYLIDENFEGGMGVFTNNSIASPNTAITNWQVRTSTYVPQYPTYPVWYPAISSGFGTNKFAMTSSDVAVTNVANTFGEVETALESIVVNTTNYINLTLSFKIYFSSYNDLNSATSEYVIVEYKNGAGAWTAVPSQQYLSDIGIGTQFGTKSFDMSAYKNITALQIRIRYKSSWADGVAIDDIKLYGDKPLVPNFTWTSPLPVDAYTNSACTIPYTAGTPVSTTIYVKPTLAQLEQGAYSFTANANLTNGCTTSATVNVTNTSKVWKGTTDNDWNKASNWLPAAVPTSSTCVIIPTGTVSKIMNAPDTFAKTVTIKAPTGNLELQSGKNLTITDNIIVEAGATFNIRDKASLIQINNVANTGSVNIERTTRPISKLDYTYWSSPVAGFTLGGVSAFNSYMYSWIPTISGNGGNWNPENNSRVMSPGNGFILRSPWGHTDGTTYTTTFVGTPNNGEIITPISKGTLIGTIDDDAENDEWNLIGNPYPSALDAAKFLNLASNVPVIEGTLYLWTHNSQPNAATIDPFYGDYALNYTDTDYAVFNTTGGTATAPASTGGAAPTGYIASGQSFFVKASNSMTNGTTANVTFNNSMRVSVEGKNGDFFKLTKNNKDESIPKSVTDIERHRIWINLTNNSGAFSQTLVGYVAGATQELDRSFDGESLGGNDVSFYSIIPEAELTIQGRALPFDENDQITLGYNSEISGELSIRIDHIDGLFDNQKIYLEDKELNIIHNLKETPYVFSTEIGDFNDRFTLRFTDKTLGTDTFSLSKSDEVNVIVNQNVTVQSSNQLIKNIAVYDLLGRKIDSYKKVNALKYTLSHLNKTTAGLIVKITLENDTVVSKKIIY